MKKTQYPHKTYKIYGYTGTQDARRKTQDTRRWMPGVHIKKTIKGNPIVFIHIVGLIIYNGGEKGINREEIIKSGNNLEMSKRMQYLCL